jgi:tRNA (cytidine32/uridine32-2'-O)-methyltransferase
MLASMSRLVHADNLTVILVEPTHPGNIGAVARAMGNMGVDDLRLVRPADHLGQIAMDRAASASGILHGATVFETVEVSVSDLSMVFGITARHRSRQNRTILLPDLGPSLPKNTGRVGLMFGRESSGLTNDELALCSVLVQIPTQGKVASLNLSHAVMVTLYELSRFYGEPGKSQINRDSQSPASVGELEGLRLHLQAVLLEIGFLKGHQETGVVKSFVDFFLRASANKLDIRMWRGMLHRVQVSLQRLRERGS